MLCADADSIASQPHFSLRHILLLKEQQRTLHHRQQLLLILRTERTHPRNRLTQSREQLVTKRFSCSRDRHKLHPTIGLGDLALYHPLRFQLIDKPRQIGRLTVALGRKLSHRQRTFRKEVQHMNLWCRDSYLREKSLEIRTMLHQQCEEGSSQLTRKI